jgi:hypothetical protein
MSPAAARRDLSRRILDLYVRLPDTPARPRPSDHRILGALLRRGVDAGEIEHALLLGLLRRRSSGEAPTAPISTLAYFLPIVEEIRHDQQHDASYRDYVRRKAEPLLLPAPDRPARKNRPSQLFLPF